MQLKGKNYKAQHFPWVYPSMHLELDSAAIMTGIPENESLDSEISEILK